MSRPFFRFAVHNPSRHLFVQLYLKNSWAKVQLGLGQGKKSYDKRQTLRERDDKRQIDRALGRRQKGTE